ncbi:hypothetical protein [Lysobacter antibioticus]|uniref:Transmembrane protein n=1 Tax=Lysobacter antibioticus TaxID=84531 RepID=A0A0S2F691_LYSAN|nr:hypothetical protein [Lysobacter antibioticus]ALN79034.1 hypothetical protein LA76x_0873 [Lysobacter antibioticus]
MIKAILTTLFYIVSCAVLVAAHTIASGVLASYGSAHLSSFGSHVPAFSVSSMTLMHNSALLCFGVLLVSAALALLVLFRAKSREAKLYWVSSLAVVNYYVTVLLLGAVAAGFFWLPKLANSV